jgi:hypothetical protein
MNLIEEKKKQLSHVKKQKICKLAKKVESFNKNNIIDKIHNLIVKELKLNVNCYIKKKVKITTTFFNFNNA